MQQEKPECSFVEDYEICSQLGDGGQAIVYLGKKKNHLYAIKVYFAGETKIQAFHKEKEFLGKLQFINLINLVEGKVDGKVKMFGKQEETRPVLVLEFAEHGELFQYLRQEGRFAPEICRPLFNSLLAAIEYLDFKGVAHRDLKPQNILFDRDFNLKVSDFGLARQTEGDKGDKKLFSKVGTEGYKSPQVELGKYEGLTTDMFAAGVILFIMFNGTPPFLSTKPQDRIFKYIREKNYTKFWELHEKKKPQGHFPQSFKNLMNAFFSADPSLRPTFASLKQDEWMNGPHASQEQLFQELKARYNRIAQNDELKKKIQKIKEDFKKQVMEEQECCGKDMENQTFRSDTLELKKVYDSLAIDIESLPLSQKNIKFVSQEPAFLITWLKKFIDENMKEGTTLVECPYGDVKPLEGNFQLQNANEVSIELKFLFEDQEEPEYFKIEGKLVRSKNNFVGMDWSKVEGNDFYLSGIITKLNQQII